MTDAYIVSCNTVTWYYPQTTWFMCAHVAAVITNTLLCVPAIAVGFLNCKVLVQLGTQNESAPTNLILLSGFVTDVVTASTMLFIWNIQYVMSLFRYTSCPVSFFTYLITMVCTFVGTLTTILVAVDRYLMVYCPFLYEQHITRSLATYGKILAYIFIIALMLTGIGFSMSPKILYILIIVLLAGSIMWGAYAYTSLYITTGTQNPTMTSYELRTSVKKRRRERQITRSTAANNVVIVAMAAPYYCLTCVSLYDENTARSGIFHAGLMWSWVLISVKVAVTPLLFYRTLQFWYIKKKKSDPEHTSTLLI